MLAAQKKLLKHFAWTAFVQPANVYWAAKTQFPVFLDAGKNCKPMCKSPKYLRAPVANRNLTAKQLLPHIQRCDYVGSNILRDIPLSGGRTAALAGFAQIPFDTRSACFTALDVTTTPEEDAKVCRNTGAPLTFLCHQDRLLWWSQTSGNPYQVGEPIPVNRLEGFFREHANDFNPQTIYRAKTLGRFQENYQRSFVDLGLMPLVEKEFGQAIERLLLDSVAQTRDALGWPKEPDLKQSQWLVKSVFWLLGAKMLHDKGVENFIRLNFGNVDEVFERVAKHYGDSAGGLIVSQAKRAALEAVSRKIDASPSLQLATTEALAYVYENTLISKEVRAEFGTHSTPSYLVDYIVGRLEPWIQTIAQNKRSVCEPGCGHGSFLIAATRLLTSLLPPHMAAPAARKKYLRDRVRGYDVDDFAVEIARLSLTLTDIPNSNGWMIKQADLFESDLIERAAGESTVLLANPPFEDFKASQRAAYARKFREPKFLNKTTEILYRALSAMPTGGVFGVVVPQSLLHESNAVDFRKLLVEQFEFQEISLFPDRVFNFAHQESAVLIGRKYRPASPSTASVRYRRVREREMDIFRQDYAVTSEIETAQSRFQQAEDFDFRVPDLENIWRQCENLPKLAKYAEVGQGFSFIGKDQPDFPAGTPTVSDKRFEGAVQGFENLGPGNQTHQLPPLKWLNLSPDVIGRPRSGTKRGMPQILLNQPPVQSAPWCLRAMIDRIGRPAKTSFTILRPLSQSISLEVLWAIANSPFANAFAYSHSSKWNILTGTWRKLPVPKFEEPGIRTIEAAVRAYLNFVARHEAPLPLRSDDARSEESENLKKLHWRIDAEVMRLYNLPAKVERQLLDYFAGWERTSVPFKQDRYFPDGFDEAISLADYLAITADWDATNKRRLKLIEKKLGKSIQAEERAEMERLQHLAGLKRELLSSPSLKALEKIEMDLRRRGLWRGM
jgi:type I restriction-modification system DNA methylase subunit